MKEFYDPIFLLFRHGVCFRCPLALHVAVRIQRFADFNWKGYRALSGVENGVAHLERFPSILRVMSAASQHTVPAPCKINYHKFIKKVKKRESISRVASGESKPPPFESLVFKRSAWQTVEGDDGCIRHHINAPVRVRPWIFTIIWAFYIIIRGKRFHCVYFISRNLHLVLI